MSVLKMLGGLLWVGMLTFGWMTIGAYSLWLAGFVIFYGSVILAGSIKVVWLSILLMFVIVFMAIGGIVKTAKYIDARFEERYRKKHGE